MTMRTVKHFIEIFYPGLIFSESSRKEIGHRDPREIGKMPRGAFAFRFGDNEYVGAVDDEGNHFNREVGGDINFSKMFYPGGKILDRAGVEALEMDECTKRITLGNMDGNGYKQVVQTCRGNLQSYDPEKQQILPPIPWEEEKED